MNSGKATWNNDFAGDAYNDAPQSNYGHAQRGGGGFGQNQNVNPNANGQGNVDDGHDDYADFDSPAQSGNSSGGFGGGPTNQSSFGRGNPNQTHQGGGGGFGGGPARSRGNVQQSVKRHGQQSRFGRRTSTINNGNGNG